MHFRRRFSLLRIAQRVAGLRDRDKTIPEATSEIDERRWRADWYRARALNLLRRRSATDRAGRPARDDRRPRPLRAARRRFVGP